MTPTALVIVTILATLIAKHLWDNRRSVRDARHIEAQRAPFEYAWAHAKLGTPKDIAWHAFTKTAPGAAAPQTPEL